MKRIFTLCACLLVLCAVLVPVSAAVYAKPVPYIPTPKTVSDEKEATPRTSIPETVPDEEEAPKPSGMPESTASLGQTLFSGIWDLFGVQFPGFNFTFRQFWIAVALCGLSIRVIRIIFNFGGAGGDTPRSSSTSNPKISKERRHDEF